MQWRNYTLYERSVASEKERKEIEHRQSEEKKRLASMTIQCAYRQQSAKKQCSKRKKEKLKMETLIKIRQNAARIFKEREEKMKRRQQEDQNQRKIANIASELKKLNYINNKSNATVAEKRESSSKKIHAKIFTKEVSHVSLPGIYQDRERRFKESKNHVKAWKEGRLKSWRSADLITTPPSLSSTPENSLPENNTFTTTPRVGIDEELLKTLGKLSSLEHVELNVEGIEDASAIAQFGMTSLRSLSLNVNKISPDLRSFSGLSQLALLSLSDNRITSLDGIEDLVSLEQLNIESNRLHSLSPIGEENAGCCLSSLAVLNANANQIKHLPSCIGERSTPYLQCLSLYQNRINTLPVDFLQGIECLVSLDLGRNRLQDGITIGRALSVAPTLRRIILSQNRLKTLPSPLILPLLQEFWLSGNDICTTENWSDNDHVYLPCLYELYLQDNCLQNIAKGSLGASAPLLHKIDLSFNEISCTKNVLDALKYLKYLEW